MNTAPESLLELIRRLEDLPEDRTIYAVRVGGEWTAESPALLLGEPEYDFNRYTAPDGTEYDYLLEVDLAREVVAAYQRHHGTNHPSVAEKLKAIIYYGEHDAYLLPES